MGTVGEVVPMVVAGDCTHSGGGNSRKLKADRRLQ